MTDAEEGESVTKSEFVKFIKPYERVLRQLLLELDFFIEDAIGVNIHSVQHRMKTYESAISKSKTQSIPIEEMQDIAGIRIVVATANEVGIIERFFTRRAFQNDLIIQSNKEVKRNGYSAKHLVLAFSGSYTRSSVSNSLVEVQLVTLIQHTYNYLSRSWVYKSTLELSTEWHREFLQISNDISILDDRIAKLQKAVVASSLSGSDMEPLTPFSYQGIVAEIFAEQVSLDNSTDIVGLLVGLQYDTNGIVRTLFSDPAILRVRQRIEAMLGTSGKSVAEVMLNLDMHMFYTTFGIRMPFFENVIIALAEMYTKNTDI